MKARLISLSVVLLSGLAVYLLTSGAPARVHLGVGLTWTPLLLFLCLLGWTGRLNRLQKAVLIALLVVAGGGVLAFVTTQVVLKVDFSITLWRNHVFLLLITFGAVFTLSHLCEGILKRWWWASKAS